MAEFLIAIARQRRTWWLLMALTLVTGALAESVEPTQAVTIAICLTVAVKGSQVIDELMGLRGVDPVVRWPIKTYFLVVPALIGAAVIFSR